MNIFNKIYFFYLKRVNPVKWARKLGVEVGANCRLLDVTFSTEPYLVKIGNNVSATKVHFETHDGGVWVFRDKHPKWDIIKPITIGNNVFIGRDVIILPGVTVGDNTIIGARSVVTKDIPCNTVVAGVPAKEIKKIDDYYNKVSIQVIETKLLGNNEKRNYLRKKFSKN
jgi:acetyltransferase-like isoleucine patch superfamily enzyme